MYYTNLYRKLTAVSAAFVLGLIISHARAASPATPGPWHDTISTMGGNRATAYPGGNKIITTGEADDSRKTHVTWLDYIGSETDGNLTQLDGARVMFRTFDHATQAWSPAQDLGDAWDNHGGATMTLDGAGRLNMVYGAHNLTPLKYRRTTDSSNTTWGAEETIVDYSNVDFFGGGTSTDYHGAYPSMLADRNDPEKMHLVFRGGGDQPWGIVYMRRQWTNYGFAGLQQGYKWNQIHTLVEPPRRSDGLVYTEFANPLAIGPTGTLHMAYHYERQTGIDTYATDHVGYMKSVDGGDTWTSAAGLTLALPVLPDSGPAMVVSRPGSEFGIGSVDADSNDNPWFTLTDRDHKTFELMHHDGTRWNTQDLTPVFHILNPNFNVVGESQLAIADGSDEIMIVASYSLFGGGWGHPSSEVALLRSTNRGENWYVRPISQEDPLKANWSALIERGVGHNVVSDPMMMFSHWNWYESHSDVQFVNGTNLGLEGGFWWPSPPVPEPASMGLIALGATALLARRT